HARGVICLAGEQAGIPVIHYSATQIKKILTGSGRAPKSQVQRAIQQELKRRTVKIRVFPNEESLERLTTAVLVEIDDKWGAETKAYIKWECQDA
ncbi:MAG: crossover junction endodeoxyribonuclease RuvC, partial [Paracoccaceae bacterium]